jgi:hypothetical protein
VLHSHLDAILVHDVVLNQFVVDAVSGVDSEEDLSESDDDEYRPSFGNFYFYLV